MSWWKDFINWLFGPSQEKTTKKPKTTVTPNALTQSKPPETEPKKPNWEGAVDKKIKAAYANSVYIDFTNTSLQKLFSEGKLEAAHYCNRKDKKDSFWEMRLSDQSQVKFFPQTGAWKRFFPNGSMLVRYPDGSGRFEEKSDKNKMMLYQRDKDGNFTEKPLYPQTDPVPVNENSLCSKDKEGNKCVSGTKYPDGSTEYTFEDGSRLVENLIKGYGYYALEFKSGSDKPVSTDCITWDMEINDDEMKTGGKETGLALEKNWENWEQILASERDSYLAELQNQYKCGTVVGVGIGEHKRHVKLTSTDFSNVFVRLSSVCLKSVDKSGTSHLEVTFDCSQPTISNDGRLYINSLEPYLSSKTLDATVDKNGNFKLCDLSKQTSSQDQNKACVNLSNNNNNNNNNGPVTSIASNNNNDSKTKTLRYKK